MKPFFIFHLISVSTSKPATPHGKIRGEFGHYNGDIGYYLKIRFTSGAIIWVADRKPTAKEVSN